VFSVSTYIIIVHRFWWHRPRRQYPTPQWW